MTDGPAQNPNGEPDEAEVRTADASLDLLQGVLDAGRGPELLEVFDLHLRKPITAQSYWGLVEGLGAYLTTDAVSLLAAIVQAVDFDFDDSLNGFLEPMGRAPESVSPELRDWLRKLGALHGSAWTIAFSLAPGSPTADDWQRVTAEWVHTLPDGDLISTLRIVKTDNTYVTLRMDPGSLMRLAARLLVEVRVVGDPSAFSDRDWGHLLHRIEPVIRMHSGAVEPSAEDQDAQGSPEGSAPDSDQ